MEEKKSKKKNMHYKLQQPPMLQSMVWILVKEAHDVVAHNWLRKRMAYYRFAKWIGNVVHIGDTFCTRLFTGLRRLFVIWSSPISESYFHKVMTTNQIFALPVLSYSMWTQIWPIAKLQRNDREAHEMMTENGRKHPLSFIDLRYLPRKSGSRGPEVHREGIEADQA